MTPEQIQFEKDNEERAVFVRQMLPCPFCGHEPDPSDALDVIYPHSRIGEYQDDKRLWGAHCNESHGGCTASVLGWSEQEAVDEWNRRAPSKEPS